MNKTTQQFDNDYTPFLGIIAYKCDDQYYLESHAINEDGKMLEGKPLAQKTLLGIAETIFDENQGKIKFGGIIPDNLLISETYPGGQYRLMWYRPEERRTLHFVKNLEIPSGIAWVPAMLYVATRTELKVYALKSNRRPNEKSKLYSAPFHNVYSSAKVCLGSAKVKQPDAYTFQNVMQYWDDMFWKSEFTHMNDGNFCKTNGNVIWKMMLEDSNKKWSSMDELVEKNATLKSLI